MKRPLKIVISGGGTGGHIFPAIAIADAVKQMHPDAELLFIGAKGRMEMQRVPAAGYPVKGLWISGFQRKLSIQNLLFPVKVMVSLWYARRILRTFNPDCVVGVGGYASGPTLRAAIALKINTLIQEQNSFPGITNRILASKVAKICTAYENMEKWFPASKTILTGNPLRPQAVQILGKREEALSLFGLNPTKRTLLIVGGSQGALGINRGLLKCIPSYQSAGIQLLWQTGESFKQQADEAVNAAGASDLIKTVTFIQRMDLAYAVADCIVSRAGAMAISEMAVIGKPVIFVPLPTAAEDHQTSNAARLTAAEAAMMVNNRDTAEVLFSTVHSLMNDSMKMKMLGENIQKFALPYASQRIAEEIIKLC